MLSIQTSVSQPVVYLWKVHHTGAEPVTCTMSPSTPSELPQGDDLVSLVPIVFISDKAGNSVDTSGAIHFPDGVGVTTETTLVSVSVELLHKVDIELQPFVMIRACQQWPLDAWDPPNITLRRANDTQRLPVGEHHYNLNSVIVRTTNTLTHTC